MDKADYENKIIDHLSDSSTYCEVQRNPTNALQTKVNNELMILKRTSLISEEEYKFLRSTTSSIPRFYPLIKTHKINNPIRPLISFIDSPTYKLAKFLSRIFLPITSKSDIKLKNTTDIKNILENTIIPITIRWFLLMLKNYSLRSHRTMLSMPVKLL